MRALQKRKCVRASCRNPFSVYSTSKQKYCSASCTEQDNPDPNPKRAWQGHESARLAEVAKRLNKKLGPRKTKGASK